MGSERLRSHPGIVQFYDRMTSSRNGALGNHADYRPNVLAVHQHAGSDFS